MINDKFCRQIETRPGEKEVEGAVALSRAGSMGKGTIEFFEFREVVEALRVRSQKLCIERAFKCCPANGLGTFAVPQRIENARLQENAGFRAEVLNRRPVSHVGAGHVGHLSPLRTTNPGERLVMAPRRGEPLGDCDRLLRIRGLGFFERDETVEISPRIGNCLPDRNEAAQAAVVLVVAAFPTARRKGRLLRA